VGVRVAVGDEASVDDVGESALETAQCFHAGLAGGEFAQEVGAAFGVVAQLEDRGDVQNMVHSPVPGSGESVSDLLAGGRVKGCGAGPGRESVPVGEAGDVADVGEDSGCAGSGSATRGVGGAVGRRLPGTPQRGG
jgi:hypothetical protein